jgi:N-acetylmuramoyl-L-alanine amidase CwlA
MKSWDERRKGEEKENKESRKIRKKPLPPKKDVKLQSEKWEPSNSKLMRMTG